MTLNASLPHRYGAVRGWAIGRPELEAVPCVIFGVASVPNRALGFHVVLEGGAQYARVPIHALRHGREWVSSVALRDRQAWECFGYEITVTTFAYLREAGCTLLVGPKRKEGLSARYWCSLDWYDNGFSDDPEQHKILHLIAVEDGTFAAMPNDRLRWYDESFHGGNALIVPKRNHAIWYAEDEG
jgi:hypothetical protein